jgi:uncharacterized protein YlxW (UPF0749 family)
MTQRRVVRPPDASMGLLNEIVARALEPDYARVAERARTGPEPSTAERVRRTGSALVIAILLGATTMVAVLQLREPPEVGESPRELLAREIGDRTAEAAALAATRDELTAEIAAIQEAVLSTDQGFFARLAETEVLSGASPVSGPGLVVVLDDGPDAATEDDPAARVQDVDLQVLTNGLWAAGAEAIAVNGHRLTSLSAIRSASQAILVDLSPILPPYRVEAIGDVTAMQTAFARSTAANHLTFLSGTYGISVDISSETSLRLPGAPSATLRHADALPGVASSEQSSTKGDS